MRYDVDYANGSRTWAEGDSPAAAFRCLVENTEAGEEWERFVDSLPCEIGGQSFGVSDFED
jgi:hypothetical protein